MFEAPRRGARSATCVFIQRTPNLPWGCLYHKTCSKCKYVKASSPSRILQQAVTLALQEHFMEEFASSGGSYGGDEKFKQSSTRHPSGDNQIATSASSTDSTKQTESSSAGEEKKPDVDKPEPKCIVIENSMNLPQLQVTAVINH